MELHDTPYPITGKISDQIAEHAIIPKPKEEERLNKTRTVVYVVDSRDRNRDRYPDPANYRVDLNDEFRDVQAIELMSVQMPSTFYTINANNDQLHVSYGDESYTVVLLHGIYKEGGDLAKAVEEGLNRNRPVDTPPFQVYFNSRLNRLVFRSPHLYKEGRFQLNGFLTLHFEGNTHAYGDGSRSETELPSASCGEVLGFAPKTYDMYVGNAHLNPLSDVDGYESQYGLLRSKRSKIDTEDNTGDNTGDNSGDNKNELEDPLPGTYYLLRSLDKSLKSHLMQPLPDTKTEDSDESPGLQAPVCYVYLRQVAGVDGPLTRPAPFVAMRLRGPRNCTSEEVDSYLVEAEMDYELPHGEYQVFVDYLAAPNMVELNPWKYLMLRVPRCHRFQSSDKTTMQSFAKIPLCSEYQINHLNALGNVKRFNPVLAGLNSLSIQFYPYRKYGDSTNRKTFDFAGGGEHVLVFAMIMRKQSTNYTT